LKPIRDTRLYLENGEVASLADVMMWFLTIYPEDIFISINDNTIMRWHVKRILNELGYETRD
jgi:hypothetical protein